MREKHQKIRPEYLVSGTKFEHGVSKIQTRSTNYTAAILGIRVCLYGVMVIEQLSLCVLPKLIIIGYLYI
jgi:hypothetical protein